jgi:primosomal protein N'
MIDAFNTNVQKLHIRGYACSYMFNASKDKNQNLTNENLYECVKQYPVFFRSDVKTVTDFVTKLTINGNGKQILIDIEEGKVVPSKKLIKVAHSILKGNNEYMLVDNQKLCYESIMSKVNDKNNVFIINGNPGTGKSVLAINLLTSLIKQKKNVRFVAPNSSFRNTLIEGILKSATKEDKKYFKLLFSGSSGFVTTAHDAYD